MFLKLDLSQIKLEYSNHQHSKFWYKKNKLTCSECKKNATNDTKWIQEKILQMIRGVHKNYFCWNSSHVLMLHIAPLWHKFWYLKQKNCCIWHSWKLKITTYHPTYLVSFCIVNSKYWVLIFIISHTFH